MGPQRKQERLDEARRQDSMVLRAYDELTTHLSVWREELGEKNPSHYKESPDVINARQALKEALQTYGMNRFSARDLSNFAGKTSEIAR